MAHTVVNESVQLAMRLSHDEIAARAAVRTFRRPDRSWRESASASMQMIAEIYVGFVRDNGTCFPTDAIGRTSDPGTELALSLREGTFVGRFLDHGFGC